MSKKPALPSESRGLQPDYALLSLPIEPLYKERNQGLEGLLMSPRPASIPRPAFSKNPANTPNTTTLREETSPLNFALSTLDLLEHATGKQPPNTLLQAISVPVENEAAVQECINNLSNDDKLAFQSATDVMEKLGCLQQGKPRISSFLITRIHKVQQCLKQFLVSIAICIQHNDAISSLVMGGLHCILMLALGYIEFFESLLAMVECIGEHLAHLSVYAIRARHSEGIHKTLVEACHDLLGFYVKFRNLFIENEEKRPYAQLSKQFLSVGEIFVQPIFDRLAGARHQIEFYKEEAHDKPRQGDYKLDERCQKMYARCESSFNKILQNVEALNDQATAQRLLDECGRFRVWAGNVGAHETGRDSLDYRLREASHIHLELTELLEELNKDLEEVLKPIEIDEGNHSPCSPVSLGEEFIAELGRFKDREAEINEFEYLVLDITHIITCLYKFSIAIQNPAPKERLYKIALTDMSYFERLDIRHIEKMFCPADPQKNFRVANYLSERLGKANTRRRQLLRDYKTHHEGVPRCIDDELISVSKPATSTMKYGGARASTKIELSPADEVEQGEDQLCQSSETTPANCAMRICVPPPPAENAAFGGEPFTCPYCFNRIKVTSRQNWKRHVFEDLQPYVCTFPDCPQAGELYGSRREWFDHEVQLHLREWYCDTCSESFLQKIQFHEHIKARHSDLEAKEHFEKDISRYEREIATDIVCPLCGIKSTLQTREKHLGRHLQEVALSALPHPGEISECRSYKLEYSSESLSNSEFDSDNKQSVGESGDQPTFTPVTTKEIECICNYKHDDGFLKNCEKCNALQASVHEGNIKAVKHLLDIGADVNAHGGLYGNALQASAYSGNVEVMRLLLDNGADANAEGGHYGNALQASACVGNIEAMQLLLNYGADVNAQGGEYGSALQAAGHMGGVEAVRLLLREGADVKAQGGKYGNALQAAALKGDTKAMRPLLDSGADVNAQGGEYGNALQAAAYKGNFEVVCLLLDLGADINAQGGPYGNALQAAVYKGNIGVTQLLVDEGADSHVQGGGYDEGLGVAAFNDNIAAAGLLLDKGADVNMQGGSALQAAARNGNIKAVQLLLDNGSDVNIQGGWYGNALQAAARNGNIHAVQLLLDNGADITAQGGVYGNALKAAAYKGNFKALRLLLDHGVDVNTQGGRYRNALQAAACKGNLEAVHLLLGLGADINAQGGPYGNALQAAAYKGNAEVVRILLDKGADINAQSAPHGNALQAAAYKGNVTTMHILLGRGADVHAQGGEYGSALQAAARNGNIEAMQLLLNSGVDINTRGGWYGNALQAAARNGNTNSVQLLLDKGADITAQGGVYGYALQVAVYKGNIEAMRLLLDNGADVNAQGGHFGNALQASVCQGNIDAVQLLLDLGADFNASNGLYGNALQAAAYKGNVKAMQLLLDNGADINAQGGKYGNALQAASVGGNVKAMQILLDKGADANARGGMYGTALQAAIVPPRRGIKNVLHVAEVLLDHGADVTAYVPGSKYGDALSAAKELLGGDGTKLARFMKLLEVKGWTGVRIGTRVKRPPVDLDMTNRALPSSTIKTGIPWLQRRRWRHIASS